MPTAYPIYSLLPIFDTHFHSYYDDVDDIAENEIEIGLKDNKYAVKHPLRDECSQNAGGFCFVCVCVLFFSLFLPYLSTSHPSPIALTD